MDKNEISNYLSNEINKSIATGSFTDFSDKISPLVQAMEPGSSKNLFLSVIDLFNQLNEAKDFISDLSNGNLSLKAPEGNKIISPFKQLHANLSHLVWQVKQLSEGDLEQRVDFLGDFSNYFNKLILSLKEKKTIENEFRRTAEKYRISIENANIGIMTVDLLGKIQTTNKECSHIFGYSQPEMEIMSINDISVPEDQDISINFINRAIVDKKHSKAEFIKKYFHKSGDIVTCQVSSSLMFDEQDRPLFFISHIKDVTRRVEASQRLNELNIKLAEIVNELRRSNAAKDKFFRIIAHDLKNHFNSILGFSEFLHENVHTDSPEEIQSQASIIYEASTNAYKLLENLLEWSMSQTGRIAFNPQQVNIESLLNEVMKLSVTKAKSKGIAVSYNLNGNAKVFADANMLRTILRNLIGNAIKYTGKKGRISITLEQGEKDALFTVRDTGPGIDEKYIDKLFTLEERIIIPAEEAQQGTGLGLILCKEFVDKHGGKIWAESIPGQGSDFKFTLPSGGDDLISSNLASSSVDRY